MKKFATLLLAGVITVSSLLGCNINANAAAENTTMTSNDSGVGYMDYFGGTLSIPIKTDSDGSVVYCLAYNKKNPDSSVTYSVSATKPNEVLSVDTKKVEAVIQAGYPAKSPEALGVKNADQANYATQAALWTILNQNGLWSGKTAFTGKSEYPEVETLYNALVAKGNAASGSADIAGEISLTAGQVKKGKKLNTANITVKIVGYSGASLAVSGSGANVYNADGEEATTIKDGDVLTVKGSSKEDVNITISATSSDSLTGPVYYIPSNNEYQPVVKIKSVTGNASASVKWTKDDSPTTTTTPTTEKAPKTPPVKKKSVKGKLTVVKIDSETRKTLAGATIQVKNSNGEVVAEEKTGKDGSFVVKNLPLGTYSAVETKAPEGYTINKTSYSVKLSKKKPNGTVAIQDVKAKLPQTGEYTPYYIYVGMLLAGAMTFFLLMTAKLKKSKAKNEEE